MQYMASVTMRGHKGHRGYRRRQSRQHRTVRLPVRRPVVAAVMQYMANVLGRKVVDEKKQPLETASSAVSVLALTPCRRAALHQRH